MLSADVLAEIPARARDMRGVYCLRRPINGLWAYYSVTSDGTILRPPQPVELGVATALLAAELADELDRVDPVTPLRVIRCADSAAYSSWPRYEPPAIWPRLALLA